MRKLSDRLIWLEDTCSVYAVLGDDATTLIDCGTHLTPGVQSTRTLPQVEQVLLTHFHRDQCSSAHSWERQGAQIFAPFVERRLIEEADLLRASYDLFDNYTSYYPCFSPLMDLENCRFAFDYNTIAWQDLTFEVVPLPGHTFGASGYLFELDGRRVLACGDLLCSPGQLRDYYWCQWKYMDFQGHVNQIESLDTVADLDADMILPGHGEPFVADAQAIAGLRADLVEIWEMFYGTPYSRFEPQFRELSPHVFEVTNSKANSYIVSDGEGHGLFIDCGYTSNAPIGANPHRFIDLITSHLEPRVGIHTVEYFLPTHYHDDHLAGYPALRARYDTQVVSSLSCRDLLQNTDRYDMPCLVPQGLSVARAVMPAEPFEWRGLHFFIEPHPGQTTYDQHIRFTVDGRTYVAIGDAISGMSFNGNGREYIHSFIPKNRTPLSTYASIPARILAHQPDVLLTGHGGAVNCDAAKMAEWKDWMERWQALFTKIVGREHPDAGMDPRWVEFYPYKTRIRPGAKRDFHLWIKNHEPQPSSCVVRFRSVEGVEIDPVQIEVQVEAGEKTVREIHVHFPQSFATHSLTIVADVTWNGIRLGEIAEAVAYW